MEPHDSPLHIVGCFDLAHAGAELGALEVGRAMRDLRPVQVWTVLPPHPVHQAAGVRLIDMARGEYPRGGCIYLVGVHVPFAHWLPQAQAGRVLIDYNLPQHSRLYQVIAAMRGMTGLEPEVVFMSESLRLSAGWPGSTLRSAIDLSPMMAVQRRVRTEGPLTIGRLSRDVAEKHHALDPSLYRELAARGHRVRIMGGTCLEPALRGVPGIELLPEGAEPAADFLASLDVFFYRIAHFNEGYGRVVLEAMATGLPVVCTTPSGYIDSVRHGVDGFLFASQEQAWQGLHALLGDAALRERMGHAAREQAWLLHGPHDLENHRRLLGPRAPAEFSCSG